MRHVLLLSVLLLAGCGPIRSTMGLVDAEKALRAAQEAGAVEKAPYQTEVAEQLLAKAKEAAGRSTYDDSMHLANESAAWAIKARDIALGNLPADGEPPAEPLPDLGEEPGDAGDATDPLPPESVDAPAADPAPTGAAEPAAAEPAADEPAADEPAADEPAADEPEPAAEPTPSDPSNPWGSTQKGDDE